MAMAIGLTVLFALGCALLGQTTAPAPVTQAVETSPPSPFPAQSDTPIAPMPTSAATPTMPAGLPNSGSASWQSVVTGLRSPVDVATPGDGRLYIVQQTGTIVIYQDGQILGTPFLDLRDRVNTNGNERGLLGLAFDPNFAETGDFYVDYTGAGGATFVSRFHADPGSAQANPSSEQNLLRIRQPYANHNGGHLAFGPDGFLYIGMGDGGSAGDPHGNGQDVGVLLGKLLRIDVSGGGSYAIPPDNPFVNQTGAMPEIWAYGLRNPWRFSFDSTTGDLYIGDVGQNQWEEIDFQPAGDPGGEDYGWSIREGLHKYKGQADGLTDPVAEYSHNDGNCSVSGGVVVRDPALPDWQGVYLYGDFCSGYVWGMRRQPDGSWLNDRLFETSALITGFGVDDAGHIYLLDRNGGLYQLVPSG